MITPYIADNDIISDLGGDVARAQFDRNRDGMPDPNELWKIRCDATNHVRTKLKGVFPNLPNDSTIAIASINAAQSRIVFADPHPFGFRDRIIFCSEDIPAGLEGILSTDWVYYARAVTETTLQLSLEAGGPPMTLTALSGNIPAGMAVVQPIPPELVTLTRGSAVMMALRTVPRLGRLPEWKAHHEALELEFAQLVRGPNVIDQGVLPHDPGANRGGPSVNVDTNIWGRGQRKCRPPTGMY